MQIPPPPCVGDGDEEVGADEDLEEDVDVGADEGAEEGCAAGCVAVGEDGAAAEDGEDVVDGNAWRGV